MTRSKLGAFQETIGVQFVNISLLEQALTHRSYLNENPSTKRGHNERLEFLGDAVLELIVTDYLFQEYPKKPEGELTNYRAALVNSDMLARVASELGVGEHVMLSKGEAKDKGRARGYILANAFEAIIGAIYEDQGYDVAKGFVTKFLLPKMTDVIERKLWKDPKSAFQEAAQDKEGVTPTYKVTEETGPDHDKRFVVGVFLDKELVASGQGASKQEAELNAARAGLEVKKW